MATVEAAAISLTDTDISDVPTFAIRELRELFDDDGSTYKIVWGISRDTRDSRTTPTTGYRTDLQLELANFGSDHDFYKMEVDTIWYKPLDEEAILNSLSKTRCAVTAEEHQQLGGLGESIAATLVRNQLYPMEMVAVQDQFGESGKPEELLDKYGLGVNDIVEAALKLAQRKSHKN